MVYDALYKLHIMDKGQSNVNWHNKLRHWSFLLGMNAEMVTKCELIEAIKIIYSINNFKYK